jgi:hypothetical protein
MIARIENNIQTGQIKYFDSNNSEIEKSFAEAEIHERQQANLRKQESPAYIEQQEWNRIRSKRDSLLSLSDWTQLEDSKESKGSWAMYRQQLRDIPQDFPTTQSVIWPSKP